MCDYIYEDYTPEERNLIAITRNQWRDEERDLEYGDCCGECEEGLESEE